MIADVKIRVVSPGQIFMTFKSIKFQHGRESD